MQINHICGNAYYIDAPVNLGLLINRQREALLIDTGIDDSVGRKVKRLLEDRGWILKAIFITHHHADHTGGAPFLVRATGATVYSGRIEKGFIEYPLTEPLYLSGGASPPASLRNKFFLAAGIKVDVTVETGECIADWDCRIIDLSGHSMGQLGLLTVDGVLFAGDALIGSEYIIKHGIPLNADIELTLASYQRLMVINPAYLLLGHGGLSSDAKSLLSLNQTRMVEICDLMQTVVFAHRSWEDILAVIANKTNMPINNQGQYALANLSATAYISYLQQQGLVTTEYIEGRQILSTNLVNPK